MIASIHHNRCSGNCVTASGKSDFVHITENPNPDFDEWRYVRDPKYFGDTDHHWLHPDCYELYQTWLKEEKYKE